MQKASWRFQWINPRLLSVLFLSFSSGLPLVLVGSTLQAWYTVAGVDLATIGILTLIGQPYVYKFLWAPLVDRFSLIPLGRRRGWILGMQFAVAAGLAAMAYLQPQMHPSLLAWVALAVAFFSASQDIAIDAYRVDVLPSSERGLGVALNTFGYRVALLIGGALALLLAEHWGWRLTYMTMAGLMLGEMLVTAMSPEPVYTEQAPKTVALAFWEPLKQILTMKQVALILIFILIYKLSDALAFALNTPFLIRQVGFTLTEIAGLYKIVALVATIIGSAVGGILSTRLGLFRSLAVFGFLQAGAHLFYMWLALIGKNYVVAVSSIFFEYFCSGLSSVAFVVFLMGLCDRRYTATQYAVFSAIAAVGRVFVGPAAAWLVDHHGWANFYFFAFLIGLPPLLLLWWIKQRVDFKVLDQLSFE